MEGLSLWLLAEDLNTIPSMGASNQIERVLFAEDSFLWLLAEDLNLEPSG